MTQKPESRPRSASASEFQPHPVVLYNPDGTPMHWSEAAKHRYGLYPRSTSGAVGGPPAEPVPAPIPVEPEPAPQPPAEPEPTLVPQPVVEPQPVIEPAVGVQVPPKARRQGDRVPWRASVGIIVIITVLALGGAVIPFCVMNWESLEWSSWFGGSANDITTSMEEPTGTEDAAAAIQGKQTSVAYLDDGGALTFAPPTGWDPVSPELLADYQADCTYLAAVAESAGPTLGGSFLNAMAVKVLDVPQGEDLAPGLIQEAAQRFVNEGLDTYDYFRVLTPTRESTVGVFSAQTATARITWNERVLVKSVYAFIAGDGLYQVELCADDVDWEDYQDIFEDSLDSFALADGGVTPQ